MTSDYESVFKINVESVQYSLESLIDDYVTVRRQILTARTVLADFYRAPLSMASVQPILDLAVELNPELKTAAFKYPAVIEEVK